MYSDILVPPLIEDGASRSINEKYPEYEQGTFCYINLIKVESPQSDQSHQ